MGATFKIEAVKLRLGGLRNGLSPSSISGRDVVLLPASYTTELAPVPFTTP